MKVWESYIRKVEPYVPGEQPSQKDVIKLNTNENPYPPSESVIRAAESFDYDRLRLYPDPDASCLVETIAESFGVGRKQVFVGVGSDDVIAMAFMTFFNSDKPILFPNITYAFYSVWADLFGIPYRQPELDENFKINIKDYMVPNGGIIFPNPNAPTSIAMGLSEVEQIIAANQESVVIVDEAYVDFGAKSAVELIDKYDNLLVVQTYSKSRSMAGMRIGYAIGSEKLIAAINAVKFSYNSYTMNQTSLVYGVCAMKDKEYFGECVGRIVKTREWVCDKLKDMDFVFPESSANFVFASHRNVPASHIFEELKKRNIYVRYFNKPLIDNYLRITIGTDEQMEQFIEALEDIIADWKE